MTPTEAAIDNLRNEAQRPNSIHAAEIALLLAQRDRYREALIRACEYIEKVHTVMPTSLHKAEAMGECAYLARVIEGKNQEALRCE